MGFSKENFHNLIELAVQHKASDIHIRGGQTPYMRILGDIVPVETKIFGDSTVQDLVNILLESEGKNVQIMKEVFDFDGAYSVKGVCRLRFNIFRYEDKLGIVLRILNESVPSFEDLHLPPSLKELASTPRGLILVTGSTGSGKSTTLAAIIEHINQTRPCHIVTIEDPVEYVHVPKKSRFTKRTLLRDTPSYSEGLKYALRQDPDVILIGEMRDTETISSALKAAETGHLVLSTLHTTNAITTIGRIIAMFPTNEQSNVKERLAYNLFCTIGQRLLPKVGGGLVVGMEIMLNNPAVRNCILGQEDLFKIAEYMMRGKGGKNLTPQTFDQHLSELYEQKQISKETLLESASSLQDMLTKLMQEEDDDVA